jgi:hypothetical protein
MKNILLFLPILFLGAPGFAQGVFSNQTNFTLEKVVQEYASQFKNIKGELLSSRQGASAYKSTLTIPGAVSTTITQSVAEDRQVISWESVLYTGKDFNTAKTRFETLFNQIKNTIIKPIGEKPLIVNGLYMNPSADKIYNTVQFDLLPANGPLQKVNIDLVLQNESGKWQIVLCVYDRERTASGGIVVK